MLKIGIYDDDAQMVQSLTRMIDKVWDSDYRIYTWLNVTEMESCLVYDLRGELDVLFLDIQLKDTNGIAVAKRIAERCPYLKIVYFTGYIEYCQSIFDGKPSGFLLKPIEADRLRSTLERVAEEVEQERKSCLDVQVQKHMLRILTKDIQYLESEKRIVRIVTRESDAVEVYQKLNALAEQLPDNFLRCHQSFLVNLDYVRRFEGDHFELYSGEEIPVSKQRQKATRESFFRFIEGQL